MPADPQPETPGRKTLNQVLAAELAALRPTLKDKVEPSTYTVDKPTREANLRGIY